MGKIVFCLIILLSVGIAEENYETLCAACHKAKGLPDQAIYRRYVLQYSSEAKIKKAMMDYLKNPSSEHSVMPEQFIARFGLKEQIKLSDALLEKAIEEMIEKYKIPNIFYLEIK